MGQPTCFWKTSQSQGTLSTNALNIQLYFQEFSEALHKRYLSKHGCNIPFYGGVRISNENKSPLCINTSVYNNDLISAMTKSVLEERKTPCKASETYYGVPVVEYTDDNATM